MLEGAPAGDGARAASCRITLETAANRSQPGHHQDLPPPPKIPPKTPRQSAFGSGALGLSSLATFAALGFGVLGGTAALPFGLYALLCQRGAERWVQDELTGAGSPRQSVALLVALAALLVLLPHGGGGVLLPTSTN